MVIVLHGGPGAPGSASGLARGLAARGFAVDAPVQRGHSVRALIEEIPEGHTLVGASWGAMLALCFAAEHPDTPVALVGCGTFDLASRVRFEALRKTQSYDVDATPPDRTPIDRAQHRAVWDDMLRLQAERVYPAAFAAIRAPVLMLHGDDDPHPGPMIAASLPISQLRYVSFPRCGHEPWRERAARDAFFAELTAWLTPAPSR